MMIPYYFDLNRSYEEQKQEQIQFQIAQGKFSKPYFFSLYLSFT